jgi:hypothetical protein
MINIITAIVALDSTARVSVHGEEVIWHDGNPNEITAEQIAAKQVELQTAYDNDHTHKRLAEYPSIDELTVALWEGVVEERMSAVTALESKRQAVKAKYPK